MNELINFFDEFQRRVNRLYIEKYKIDEMTGKGKKRGDSALEVQPLYISLAQAHDLVRSQGFEQILEAKFVATLINESGANELLPLRPLFNQYILLTDGLEDRLYNKLAKHLVFNAARPLKRKSENGAMTVLDQAACTDPRTYQNLMELVKLVFTRQPYMAFLYTLSLTETYLPTPRDLTHESE